MLHKLPKHAIIEQAKTGKLNDPGGPHHGELTEIRLYRYVTASQDKKFIEIFRNEKLLCRKQITGKNNEKWQTAYNDMAQIII